MATYTIAEVVPIFLVTCNRSSAIFGMVYYLCSVKYVSPFYTQFSHRHDTAINRKRVKIRSNDYIGRFCG